MHPFLYPVSFAASSGADKCVYHFADCPAGIEVNVTEADKVPHWLISFRLFIFLLLPLPHTALLFSQTFVLFWLHVFETFCSVPVYIPPLSLYTAASEGDV